MGKICKPKHKMDPPNPQTLGMAGGRSTRNMSFD